jgi:hypothetical protein
LGSATPLSIDLEPAAAGRPTPWPASLPRAAVAQISSIAAANMLEFAILLINWWCLQSLKVVPAASIKGAGWLDA